MDIMFKYDNGKANVRISSEPDGKVEVSVEFKSSLIPHVMKFHSVQDAQVFFGHVCTANNIDKEYKAMKHKRKEVLFFDCENWTINIIGASDNTRAVTWKDVLKCVWFYMGSKENGSLKKRITSVLMRLLTCTLKPKQVFWRG